MPSLVPEAGRVLRRAWSIRFIVLAALFSGVEIALPYLDGLLPIGRGVFAILTFAATVGAFVARIVAQRSVSESRS